MKTVLRLLAAALLALPAAARANDYLSDDPTDWFRYSEAGTGQQVTARIERTAGNWKLWSDWAGMGPTWVYSSDRTRDYFWLWNGQTHTLVANLSGQVGEQRVLDMPCNQGPVTLLSRGPLSTPAGDFGNVVRLGFTTSCADAGVTSVWIAEGVGVVKYTVASIAGERTYELETAFVGGRLIGGAPSRPSPGPALSIRAPAEHEPIEAVLWGANDTYIVLPTYRDAFRALHGSGVLSDVSVASQSVASQLRYEMVQAGVPLDDVEIYVVALDSVWMRDYGPIILQRADGTRVVGDLDYYYTRPQDDDFPIVYAQFRGWDRVHVPVSYEGGNFGTDGRGTQFLSYGVQWFNRDLSQAEIEREFGKLGSRDFVWLEPLVDEGTTHIDMFCRIMSDDTALVSSYPASHRQARVVDAAAAAFRARGYRVVRVAADHQYDEYATYSNSVLANGIALVPQYTSASKNAAALRAYRDLGYRAVGVDSRLIIRYAGATHCVSMQVPAGR
ncbi:MAG: hypothetical protein D6731_08420 [Planctomycetota bacterium]|nr:MAG: hypothetical protein D6731_08420 [Planctomycetota bacterium]